LNQCCPSGHLENLFQQTARPFSFVRDYLKPRHARGFLLCRRYSGRGGLRGTLCARAALPQYGGDMETDHEKAQYARDFRWSRVVDCDALLASMVAKECGALP